MAKIASLGSALQDIYLIDHDDFVGGIIPGEAKEEKEIFKDLQIGTKADIDRISFETGGGGTNSATTFARCGHEATFIGNIGRDPAGEAILACLDEEGIDSSYVYFASRKKTGVSVILLDTKSGERTILTHRGASAKFDNLDPKDLEEIKPDWLYVTSLRGDLKTLEKFLKKAKELNSKVMWNPGKLELKEPKKVLSLLKYVDVLLVNKTEAGELVGGTDLRELLNKLRGYAETVIITCGGMGAIATDGTETIRLGLYEDIPVKDTTGAGDSFGSGFLAALASGKSFEKSLVFAAANSTSVVGKLGAKPGILTGKEKLHQMPLEQIK
ncbi:carbohydrate kinase family protein [Candidatus Saccharibacteria bacterium]|nr:carbohydrate kinase family protein [Candidatus Saccharibacteria bacterium]